jgi:hypothetical protein
MLKRRVNGDHALRPRNLQLEVGVVGDCHEFGYAGHLEGENFLAKVACSPESDG